MIVQFIVLLFIVLFTLYMANEGPLSSLLLLAASFFASTLAMGLYRAGAKPILAHQPDLAYGGSFLLIFFLAFLLIRTAFDYLVRGDVQLPLWPNRIVGGVFGFFTAMIIIGSLMVGIQMLPLPTSILGYNRYSSSKDLAENTPSGLWLDPDGFVVSLWDMVSGQSLGGHSFAKYHPHPLREFYADRYTVQYAGKKTLAPSLLHVKFSGPLPADKVKQLHIPAADQQVILVRTEVYHGSTPPDVSSDQDYFRLTPAEVQLITTGGNMYFPTGYVEFGRHYIPLKLHDPLVLDYRNVHGHQMVIQDWIFTIPSTDQPLVLRMKQTAAVNVAMGIGGTKIALLPRADYPQLPYNNSSLDIKLAAKALSGAPVHLWVITADTALSHVRVAMQDAAGRLGRIHQAIKNGKEPWAAATIHGTPNLIMLEMYLNSALSMVGQREGSWSQLLPVFMASQMGPSTSACLTRMRTYFHGTIEPLMLNQRVAVRTVNAQGQISKPVKLGPGRYVVVIWTQSASQMRIWYKEATVSERSNATVQLTSGNKLVDYSLAP